MRFYMLRYWILLAVFLPSRVMAEESVIAVIVSAQPSYSVPVTINDLASIYWRKKLYGHQGKPLHPANLSTEHPLRQRFSQQVLHSSPKAQLGYWNGLYFQGVQPPYTVESQEAMIRYVAYTEGAVGYIEACKLDERVRAVVWLTANKIQSEPPNLHCDSGG